MPISNSQSDFPHISITELRETLQQALPTLERLVHLARTFCTQESLQSPCDSCSKRKNCYEPCNKLKKLLPDVDSGRSSRENCNEFHESTLIETKRPNVFQDYEDCEHIFTAKQWIVICHYYRDGKTLSEIAKQLHKTISTISEQLKRARKRKQEHDRQLRKEQFSLLKP